jgi:hypothetical protein
MFLFASSFSLLEVTFIIPAAKNANAAIPATAQYAVVIFTYLWLFPNTFGEHHPYLQ